MGFTNDPTDNTADFPVAGGGGGGGGGGVVTIDGPSLAALEEIGLDAATIAAIQNVTLTSASLAALESIDLNPATIAALNADVDLAAATIAALTGDVALDAATLAALASTRGTTFDQAKVLPITSGEGITAVDLFGWSFKNTFAGLTEISLFLSSGGTGSSISINLAENETVTQMLPDALSVPNGVLPSITAGSATGLVYVDQAAAAVGA